MNKFRNTELYNDINKETGLVTPLQILNLLQVNITTNTDHVYRIYASLSFVYIERGP